MTLARDATVAPCRLLIVSNIPTPYNDALNAELAKLPGLTLQVAYCAALESNRQWKLSADKGYRYSILWGIPVGPLGRLNPGVFGLVRRFDPSVVILSGSYGYPTIALLAWWLTRRGVPWFYWGEEINWEPVNILRRMIRPLRRQLLGAEGILAIGERSAQSFERVGIPRERIHVFHYYADTAHFELDATTKAAERTRVRREQEIPELGVALLFVGELTHRKGVDTLLRAFAAMKPRANAWLMIVGDGEERDALLALASELGIAERTRFVGFVQPATLPAYMASADVLVVPSRKEGWGVVVTEAMAAGVPVVASNRVNAAAELLRDSESGFVFPVDDVAALASVLSHAARLPEHRQSIAKQAHAVLAGERSAVAADRLARIVCRHGRDGGHGGHGVGGGVE